MIDASTFREVMSQWPSGVTVVTTLAGGPEPQAWHGMTASSFSSVSLDPPLVSICLSKTLWSHRLISQAKVFGINVLAKDQIEVGRRFAGMDADVTDRFAGESWTTASTGVPLLNSALGWFDCRLVHAYDGGDHTIFVGEVIAGHAARRSAPLLFHSRGWGQFADVLPDVATLADGGLARHLGHYRSVESVAKVVREVAAAGARVRIADLADDSLLPMIEALVGGLPPGSTSALVTSPTQIGAVLARGVETVEIAVDPAGEQAVERLLDEIGSCRDRTAVILRDPFPPERLDLVLDAVQRLGSAGVAEIGLPDQHGSATPLRVRALLQEAVPMARPVPLRVGLHDRDRLGLVKALTALKSGVRHFDTTLLGMGGAVATEDLIRLLEEVDVSTPVDSAALAALADGLRALPDPVNTPTNSAIPADLAAGSRSPLATGVDLDAPQTVGATG